MFFYCIEAGILFIVPISIPPIYCQKGLTHRVRENLQVRRSFHHMFAAIHIRFKHIIVHLKRRNSSSPFQDLPKTAENQFRKFYNAKTSTKVCKERRN